MSLCYRFFLSVLSSIQISLIESGFDLNGFEAYLSYLFTFIFTNLKKLASFMLSPPFDKRAAA